MDSIYVHPQPLLNALLHNAASTNEIKLARAKLRQHITKCLNEQLYSSKTTAQLSRAGPQLTFQNCIASQNVVDALDCNTHLPLEAIGYCADALGVNIELQDPTCKFSHTWSTPNQLAKCIKLKMACDANNQCLYQRIVPYYELAPLFRHVPDVANAFAAYGMGDNTTLHDIDALHTDADTICRYLKNPNPQQHVLNVDNVAWHNVVNSRLYDTFSSCMQNAFINGNVVNNGNHFECHPAAKSKLFRTGNCGSDNCAKIAAVIQQQLSGQRDQFYATLSAACKAHHTSLISGC